MKYLKLLVRIVFIIVLVAVFILIEPLLYIFQLLSGSKIKTRDSPSDSRFFKNIYMIIKYIFYQTEQKVKGIDAKEKLIDAIGRKED